MWTPRFRAAAAVCSEAVSTAARMSSGRRSSRTRPESSFESSRRFCASQSSRSICWPLDSRNSVRASGSSPAPCMRRSLNVRSAASGVRSSCDTSARKSRSRSRSRRMTSTLSSTLSAIALNWTASSAISDEPERTWRMGTRRARSPSASPRAASVSWRSGVVKRRASQAETTTLSPRANSAMAANSPVTLPMAVARNVYGFESVTFAAYGPQMVPPVTIGGSIVVASCVWPSVGGTRFGAMNGPSAAGTKAMPSPRLHDLAQLDRDVGLAERVGHDALDLRVQQPGGDLRVHLVVEPDDRAAAGGVLRLVLDVRGDRIRAEQQVRTLLIGEVGVQTVEDEHRHEEQRQRDDRDERGGQATLEGPRHEPAQAVREPHPTTPGRVSARRRRSRHPAPSGRTPGRPGRPRSCRADG